MQLQVKGGEKKIVGTNNKDSSLFGSDYSINDASASNTYLIKIMPGTYEIPDWGFFMKSFVDVEGSGRKVTKLHCLSADQGIPASVVYFVNGASSEIRNLTIEHEGGQYIFGVAMWAGGSPRITDVDIVANGGTWSGGLCVGYGGAAGSNPTLTNVTITTSPDPGWNSNTNHGIEIHGGSVVTLHNVKIYSVGPNLSIDEISDWGTGSVVKGSVVELSRPMATSGNFKCIGCFDSNYDPLP